MEVDVNTQQKFLLVLNNLAVKDTNLAGAKAANEAVLFQAGFPVPNGFVLTTAAFDHFLAANGLDQDSQQELVADAPVPAEVLEALYTGMAALGDAPLAVRSSAVAEDLPGASFAGQYETVLDVRGPEELVAAVRRCWASVFKEHVVAYRQRLGLETSSMAVLIQRLIPADAAGVAFTANPVSGERDEVVISAVRGLGERLVSGQASPDEWTVKGDDARYQQTPEDAITADQARSIAEMARKVEAHFAAPQDIEWAIADDKLYLLQARPITALPEESPSVVEPIPIEVEVPAGYWVRNAGHTPQPNSPMHNSWFIPYTETIGRRMFGEFGLLMEDLEFRIIGGWEYIRIVPLGGKEGPELPSWLMWLLVRMVPVMRKRINISVDAVRSDKAGGLIRRWYDEWQPELEARIVELRDVELASLSDKALQDHLDVVDPFFGKTGEVHGILHMALGLILYDLVTTCRDLLGWDEPQAFELVNGTSFKSTEPARRLHELAQMALARPDLLQLLENVDVRRLDRLADIDSNFAGAFENYMRTYGCRGLGYEIADSTLAEEPDLVLDLIRGQIQRSYDPSAVENALSQRRAETADEARAMLADRPEELVRFERVLKRARLAYPVREDNEFFTISAPVALMRYALLELGERLAARGVIDQLDDVFYLKINEARQALIEGGDLRNVIQRRQGERAWSRANPGPPSYGPEPSPPPSMDFLPDEARMAMEAIMWYLDPEEEAGRAQQSGSTLRGLPVSAGKYTGPVRVILHKGEFDKLQPGDVLVCRVTEPVWSVLFPSVGALVTDTGGILSHPAIIAREYQVPAVVDLGNATSLLKDGQIVTVDGTAGTVKQV
jgi:pyruvate,water dikinase